MSDAEDMTRYIVLINDEKQYSIWPDDRSVPAGWKDAGMRGTRADCLEHIEGVWKDMRPLSVRRALEATASTPVAPAPIPTELRDPKNDLVARLEPEQAIRFVSGAASPHDEFESQLRRGRLYIRFEGTGTELGIPLGKEAGKAAREALARGAERVALEGALVLNFTRVRFDGAIDAKTLCGVGRLERIDKTSPP